MTQHPFNHPVDFSATKKTRKNDGRTSDDKASIRTDAQDELSILSCLLCLSNFSCDMTWAVIPRTTIERKLRQPGDCIVDRFSSFHPQMLMSISHYILKTLRCRGRGCQSPTFLISTFFTTSISTP